MIEINAPPVI